jgi:hypothetical protein
MVLAKKEEPGPVAHARNPSFLGDRDQEDHGSKSAQAKFHKTISTNGWTWWFTPVTPASWGSTAGRIVVRLAQA